MALPTYFIAHGGGPMPLLGDAGHAPLIAQWKKLAQTIEKPKAIVVISAHWEEKITSITSAASTTLYYDYYGFPPEAYEVQYPAPGDPALATRIKTLLSEAGIAATLDGSRGLDHGAFVPLKLIFPAAAVPVLQISLYASLDPQAHVALGRALAPLRNEGVLLLGSGFNFHNMRAFFSSGTQALQWSAAFNRFLIEASTEHVGADRDTRLAAWAKAPHARDCHPREEHLLPLLVVAAAAGSDPGQVLHRAHALNVETLDFRFGSSCA